MNGAAARLVQKDDIVIIISYAIVSNEELATFKPRIALMNDKNQIVELIEEEPPLTVI